MSESRPLPTQDQVAALRKKGLSLMEIGREFGVNHQKVRRILGLRGDAPATKAIPSESITNSGSLLSVTLDSASIRTPEALLEHLGFDPNCWEVKTFTRNTWEQGAKGPDGNLLKQALNQVKAVLSPRKGVVDTKQIIADLLADAKEQIPKRRPAPKVKFRKPTGMLLELGIVDHHFGKLAWGEETNWENYDFATAATLYRQAMAALIDRAGQFRVERILCLIGNDLLHINTRANQTFAGTPMDVDTRYTNIFKKTRSLLVEEITRLRDEVAPVDVLVVPGNHDEDAAFHMGDSLDCWFNGDKHVTVTNGPAPRKYVEWGRVMLMFCHGHNARQNGALLPGVMANERPEMWGRTLFREAHLGHRHTKSTIEVHGARVRWLPAMCAPDNWHSQKDYVGNIRSSEAFVWSKEEGQVGAATYSIRKGEQT